jgi:hypothetical protein
VLSHFVEQPQVRPVEASGVVATKMMQRSSSSECSWTKALVAKLLDSVTQATREASQRRVGQLVTERRELRSELESLERLRMSEQETPALVVDTAAFLAGLAERLERGELGERQAALRRCLATAAIEAEGLLACLELRAVPAADAGVGPGPTHRVETPWSLGIPTPSFDTL